jgi:hypothetical protein
VRLARRHNIPVWNGPSHTTAVMAAFAGWLGASRSELSALAWGITAFWRLHYDHTFSPSHTLHEVMDIASNFGLPYSIHAPYATRREASVEAVVNAAMTATADFRSALTRAGGAESLPAPLAARARSLLGRATGPNSTPWRSGLAFFSAVSSAAIGAARALADLTRDLDNARTDILRQAPSGDVQEALVFRANTDDAMAAGMQRVMAGHGPQPSQPGLARLREAANTWQRSGRQEARVLEVPFDLELTALAGSGGNRTTIRVGRLGEATLEATRALAGQINEAFRHLYHGAAPVDSIILEVLMPGGPQRSPAVMSAASMAAGLLHHDIMLRYSSPGPAVRLCP